MVIQWFPILLGWLVASLGLIAEHIALWGQPWRLEVPWSYIVGVLTITAGCAVWAAAHTGGPSADEAFIAFCAIAWGSGGWIALAYYIRGRMERAKKAAEKRGEVVGSARGMIAELERDGTHDPSRHN